jgi:hypothetical protein
VIVTDKVFDAVTNVLDVVCLSVVSVAPNTWITCPALAPTVSKDKLPEPSVCRTFPA